MKRWFLALLLAFTVLAASPAQASNGVNRDEGIKRLELTRQSVDRTLSLLKAGHTQQALDEAVNGYLTHFELVEIPLRVADNRVAIEAESKFSEIRTYIKDHAATESIREQIIVLRGLLDNAERKLTDAGLGAPAIVTTQAFLILFREGFEVVLLLSVLLGYLETAKSTKFLKPILGGVALAAAATVATVLAMPLLFSVLPFGREVLEAVTALIAVVVLFYVSFWLIARLEHKRWLEFVRARMWRAISVGSTASLVAVGFTAVYREGFETALFYQALLSFGSGLGGYILLGVTLALAALAVVAWAMFRLGRKLPIATFMTAAVAMVMITSVAFLGNAVHQLQAADVVGLHRWSSWPKLPIFLAEATGFWTTRETIVAQAVLSSVYMIGGLYVFAIKPRLARRIHRVATQPVAV